MTKQRFSFPGKIALAAFLFYVLTLSWGGTKASLPLAAKVAGWDWLPLSNWPLVWLLTLPLRLLPGNWIIPALNLMAAAIGALTLGLLARCVDLMPWDCPPKTNRRWLAQLPALLAVTACGLEFSFWQAATAATGEMMDLPLLAVVVWCLMEYRARPAEEADLRWLYAAALAWGVGMSENWVMLPTVPLFAIVLIGVRRFELVDKPFLLRSALLGLAGFSLFLLPPLVNCLSPHSPLTFKETWLATLRPMLGMLKMVYFEFFMWHRMLLLVVSIFFLLPTLPCFVRMKNEGAAINSELDSFQIIIYRVLRVGLLLACVWLAFDPVASLRAILRDKIGVVLSLVTFDYVDALGIALLAGNLLYSSQLLVPDTLWAMERLNHRMRRWGGVVVIVFFLAVTGGLLLRNGPVIRLTNREPLQDFGRLVVHSLPGDGGVVLGTEPLKMLAVQAALAHDRKSHAWQVVNVNLLSSPKYRGVLERKHPSGWWRDGKQLNQVEMLTLLSELAQSNRIFSLESHAGAPMFELFQPQPLGAVHEMVPLAFVRIYSPPPALSPRQLVDQEQFWDQAWAANVAALCPPGTPPGWARTFRDKLALGPVVNDQAVLLGHWYSALLVDWGVALQENGKLPEARSRFELALAVNPQNMAAEVNLRCCTNMMLGKTLSLGAVTQVMDKFKNLQELSLVINECGEFDEPAIRCLIGNACLAAGWLHQSWQEYDRARVLAPETLTPELALGRVYARAHRDDQVLAIIDRLRPKIADTNNPAVGPKLEIDFALLEAHYWMSQSNLMQASHILGALLLKHPGDALFADTVFSSYLVMGEARNALEVVDSQLAKAPNDLAELNNKAAILILTKNAGDAVPVLDHILSLTNIPAIRLNRATAYLQLEAYDEAEKDYTQLENTDVNQFKVEFALAQIATHRHDTNAAVQHLKLCLTKAPLAGAQWSAVWARLNALTNAPAK